MMLLMKMEDYSSSFPSLCMDDVFHVFDGYDNGPYGWKKKKKPSLDVAECRLDSPCNSPEVIMSGGVEDGAKRCQTLLHSDSFTDEYDSAENGSTSDGVDMEGFCEIVASMTAGEDIMLSSSAKESMKMSKKEASVHNLSKLTMEDVRDVSVSHNGSCANSSCSSALQSEFENDVDALLESSLSRNKVGLAEAPHDLLPDLSGFTLSGYLLSDIPSHPDLFCEAPESVDPLLNYCSDSDERLKSAVSHIEHNDEDITDSIKCEESICPKDSHAAVYSDFDTLCTNILLNDMQASLNDRHRASSCQCRGRDCLCYKSDTSSAEEEDACIEYIISQRPSKVRRAKGKSSRVVRRGPGRPRKIQNTEFIRRGPGRPRKKSVSDAVVWYQTRRKRTVSFSNGYKPRSRQKSLSDDKDAPNFAKRAHLPDNAADKIVKPKRNREGETGRPCQHAVNKVNCRQFVEVRKYISSFIEYVVMITPLASPIHVFLCILLVPSPITYLSHGYFLLVVHQRIPMHAIFVCSR